MAGLPKARGALTLSLCILLAMVAVGAAQAWEVQLAGIRLGQHAVNVLDVYGEPDGIQTHGGADFAGAGAAPAGAGEMEGMGEMAAGEEPMMGGGMMAEAPPEEAGAGEFPAGEGAGVEAGVTGAGGAALQRNPFPRWALPVWFDLEGYEVEWFYRIGPVVLGIVLDRDGYVKTIAVAARECNFARTALWVPHGYVKLGDDYKRVIYRYGWPDRMLHYYATEPGEVSPDTLAWGAGGGDPVLAFGWDAIGRAATREAMLLYDDSSNITFTIHDMKVVRIHIWSNE